MRKESTTKNIGRGFVSTLALSAALILASCSSDNDLSGTNGTNEQIPDFKGVVCTVEPRELVDFDAETRSTLTFSSSGLQFSWESGDQLSMFSGKSDEAKQIYSLSDNRDSDTKAYFTGGGFDLTKGVVYYALSKNQENTTYTANNCNFVNKTDLTFNFDGQRQTTNSKTATDHLGRYDFMAASNICVDNNIVSLHFKHLCPTLRIIIEAPENTSEATEFKGKHFTELTLYSSDNTFRQPVRKLDLTKGLQLDNTYSPKWNDIDKTTDDYINSAPFTLKLGPEPANPGDEETGFQPDGDGKINAYIQIPPEDFTGKDVVVTLKATDGSEYYCKYTGKNFEPSKAYQLKANAQKATQFEVNLRVNHRWQNGATEEVTRATGDPGYDKDLELPTHLYYIFCVDGKVKKVKVNGVEKAVKVNGVEKAVNEITSILPAHWSTSKTEDKVISTYIGADSEHPAKFTFTVTEAESNVSKNVYFVASKADLSNCFSGINEGTPESTVQALTYSIQIPTTGTDAEKQTASQHFLSSLYSTPFVSTETFVGNLKNVVKDVFLYHVAAKVDLKWNDANGMTPSTHNVSVSNVVSSGLSLFKPTTNNNTSGDYTVTTPITWGTFNNGRQVYYLPQFSDNTYNVTIGDKTSNIQFKETSTDGGFTSWYRALIQQ